MTGKGQAAGFAIHFKDSNVVSTLITAVKKLSARVEVEAARVVSSSPFILDKSK